MGANSDKVKYLKAFRSIRIIIEKSFIEGTINDVYLINIDTIKNYLEILNKHNVFELIYNSQRSELIKIEEDLKDDFAKYELEKEIQVLHITENNFRKIEKKEFIMVDKNFLVNMNVDNSTEPLEIFVKKDETINVIRIKLSEEKYIKIDEVEGKKGIFKFVEEQEKPIELNEYKGDSTKNEEDEDPDVYNDLRKPKIKIKERKEDEEGEEDDEDKKKEQLIESDDEYDKKAYLANLDEIIRLIFLALQNSEEQDEIITEEIQKYINKSKLDNKLKENEGIIIVENIQTAINLLLKQYNKNPNLNDTINSNKTLNNNDRSEYQNLTEDIINASSSEPFLRNNNHENIPNNNQSIKNPFNFEQVKIFQCNHYERNENITNTINYYKISLNKICDDLDSCFKLKFKEKCNKCKRDAEYSYKIKTTPEILIIIFDEPKKNKNFIKLNSIDENFDLSQHLYEKNNLGSNKYKLIKTFYASVESNDKLLYIDIPEKEKSNYIPNIIFYKKV